MVAITGSLRMATDAVEAHLTAQGRELRLDVADPVAFVRATQTRRPNGLTGLRILAVTLHRVGVTLRVFSDGRELLVLGQGAAPGMTGKLLRVPHLQVHERDTLARILRSWR